jgi:hypothetical protein
MKRLALVLIAIAGVVAVVLPAAARAAACSPLDCAASQFEIGQHGSLMGFRTAIGKPVTVVDLETGKTRWVLPAGLTGGSLLAHQAGRTLVWYDASRGTRRASIVLPDAEYSLAGVSQDGTRAVLTRTSPNGTTFLVASRHAQRSFTLAGKQWSFDALRGDNLFLIRYLALGGYQVRLVHVGTGRLDPKPLKDPHESSTIWGSPFSRLSSADGRYLFTLYIGPNGGSMIHVLDLQAATARCVDLPGTGNYGSATTWALTLSHDQSKLWAVSPGYGRVVAIDVHTRKVSDAFRIDLPYWNVGNTASAALAPDGRHIALADGETVAVVGLAERKVVQRTKAHAVALGYSPAGRLWQLS